MKVNFDKLVSLIKVHILFPIFFGLCGVTLKLGTIVYEGTYPRDPEISFFVWCWKLMNCRQMDWRSKFASERKKSNSSLLSDRVASVFRSFATQNHL